MLFGILNEGELMTTEFELRQQLCELTNTGIMLWQEIESLTKELAKAYKALDAVCAECKDSNGRYTLPKDWL